jgi:hypothetical protein
MGGEGSVSVCLVTSSGSDLTESSVFIRVPRATNRPKVVAKLVARGNHLRAALMNSVFLDFDA